MSQLLRTMSFFKNIETMRASAGVAAGAFAALAAASLLLQGCAAFSPSGNADDDGWGDDGAYGSGILPDADEVASRQKSEAAAQPAPEAAEPGPGADRPEAPAEPAGRPVASDDGDDDEDIFKTEESQVRSSKFEPLVGPGYRISVTVMIGDRVEVGPKDFMVSDRGELILPLLGRVPCEGLTINALHSRLAGMYGEFFADPEVFVAFAYSDDGISPYGQVLVQGRVHREGWINIPPTRNLRLSHAIQRAGGFASSALRRKVAVTRRDDNGEQHKIIVDFKAIGKNGALEKDIILEPNDVVYVDESNF